MAMPQYYPSMPYFPPQHGFYPGQPQSYYPQQQFYQPQPYPAPYPSYGSGYQPQQSWQPGPPQEGGFHHHDAERAWDPQKIYAEANDLPVPDYNHPPNPQYGKTHDGTEDFVKPDRGLGDVFGGQNSSGGDKSRGIGATVLGGAAGGFIGHKVAPEHGAIGTLGGVALGVFAAHEFEKHHEKKKEAQREHREYDNGYDAGERRGSHSRSRSVGARSNRDFYDDDRYSERRGSNRGLIEDDRYSSRGYEDDRYSSRGYEDSEPPRHHHHHHHQHHEPRDYEDEYEGSDVRSGYRDDYSRAPRSDYYDDQSRVSRSDYHSDHGRAPRSEYYDNSTVGPRSDYPDSRYERY